MSKKVKTLHIGERIVYGTVRIEMYDMYTFIKLMDYKTNNVRDKAKFHLLENRVV